MWEYALVKTEAGYTIAQVYTVNGIARMLGGS